MRENKLMNTNSRYSIIQERRIDESRLIEDPETYAEDDYAFKSKESTYLKSRRKIADIIDS